MNSGFYRAFEERFRGPRELVKLRLREYLPFVEPFKETNAVLKACDVGCGRGEWIELMMESGFEAYGVDNDEQMLEACYKNNLSAEKGDAVKFLKTLKDESHIIISAFHVVEHISFKDLYVLVEEALRVLRPGGLLIMETPNPENIDVATKGFYSDPTHQKPIPPELLSFLPEYCGFKKVKILRLNESKDLLKNNSQSLSDVVGGVSPDYAVIAQKDAPREILDRFDQAFNREYGLALETLTRRYDASILASADRIETKAADAEAHARQAESWAVQAKAHAHAAESRAVKAEVCAQAAACHATEAQITLNAVYASLSWRITWPLRQLSGVLKWILKMPMHFVKWTVTNAMAFAIKRDALRLQLLERINEYPRLKARLYTLGQERGLFKHPAVPSGWTKQSLEDPDDNAFNLEHLSPRAREIYQDLKKAMEQRQKKND